VYLRDPTTGGVFASWGSLGHLTIAEPGALVGFLGPRVYESLYGEPFPAGVQTAENLYACGLVDAVTPVHELGDMVDRALRIITRSARGGDLLTPAIPPQADIPAWQSVIASRRPDRPGVRQLLQYAASDVVPLNGTGQGESDPGLLLALTRFGDMPCVVLGQDRHAQTPETPLGPAALRQARRGMRLAAELNLPLVTVIDTAGAALSRQAEERGLAGEIARCIADMVALEVPTVSVLLGQGTGGGALALAPADRILAAQHGWLSPLPPEGASAILYHDTSHAPAMAAKQGVRSADLLAHGIIDRVIPEFPDAAAEPEPFCRRVGAALHHELAALGNDDTRRRLTERVQRFDRIGHPDPVLAQAV
jgi:acyl-CoA carboxylase subunit beta